MKILKRLIKRNIAGDIILVPVGDASLEIKGLITLNETGEFLWDALEKAETKARLRPCLPRNMMLIQQRLRPIQKFFAKTERIRYNRIVK